MLSPRSRNAALAVFALVIFAACWPGAHVPTVEPRGTLSPGREGAGASASQAPFSVIFAGPRGETEDATEISVVFDRPVRSLEVAASEPPPPISIQPAPAGRWAWVGTRALQFVPEKRLPRATTYVVEVPAGTRALDGSTLAAPYRFSFSTPRPTLVRSEPGDGDRLVDPAARFALRFDQPVAEAEIARAVTLKAGAGAAAKPVAFDVRRPDAANPMRVELAPRSPLPRDAALQLVVDASLRGTEGPLPAGKAQTLSMRTFPPAGVASLECDRETPRKRCDAAGGLDLSLATPVKLGALRRALLIEPKVALELSGGDDDDEVEHVYLRGRFAPGRSYRLRLRAQVPGRGALVDRFGQALARDWSTRVEMDDAWPDVEIGVSGEYLEAGLRAALPIGSINVPELTLVTARVDEAAAVALGADPPRGDAAELRAIEKLAGAKVQKLAPGGAKNATARTELRLDDVLGEGGRGTVAVGVRWPDARGGRDAASAKIVQVTDLGITAKVSRDGTLVWVTRLSTGTPVDGATVEIRTPDESSGTFRTGPDGLVELPADRFRPADEGPQRAVIVARAGDDWAWRRVDDQVSTWGFGAPSDLARDDRPYGLVFTDRGVYRPGDLVHFTVIARVPSPRGTETPKGRAVKLVVDDATGEAVMETSERLSAFGTLSGTVTVPPAARLGTFRVRATLDGSPPYSDVEGSFEVAEYRPVEMRVGVEAARPSWIRGDRARWTAHGEYLYGAPASGREARVSVTREPTSFRPPNLEEAFGTDAEAYWADRRDAPPRAGEVQSSRATLDANGDATIDAPLPMPGQRGPERVTCEVEVTDMTRQTVAGRTSTLVHPGEVYLALDRGTPSYLARAGQAVSPRLLAVDPAGVRRAQVAVHLELVHRTWAVAREDAGGEVHSVVSAMDRTVASCDVTTRAEPVGCALVPPSAGYFVVHATTQDARGNPVEAAAGFIATGDGTPSWADGDPHHVELVPDKAQYAPGDVAHVLVKSPWPGAEALVTVERAGILRHERRVLAGATPILDVPIGDELRPNAFVSVVLVRGRTKPAPADPRAADVGEPSFRVGYASLEIDPAARRLAVEVKPSKTDAAPGDEVEVEVAVTSGGKPARAELTLYAVDEGALSLTGYETPDPLPVFTAPRPLRVVLVESRASLAAITLGAGSRLGVDKGMDGGGGGAARRDFRQTAWFEPSLVTDASGVVKRRFRLPDGLTTYRIMAIAVAEDDRTGAGASHVVASKKLMIRPALPRVLRAGDRVELAAVLASKGLPAGRATIAAQVDGLVVEGPAERAVDLPANGSVEVRWPARAERAGTAKIRWTASAGGAHDALETTRSVATPIALEAVALSGETTTAAGERLGDLAAIRDDVGGLDVGLASTALVGLGAGFEQLLGYPYGCTEQLTSRLVPLVAARDLARDFGIPVPAGADALAALTVGKILANQRGDGGFGLWNDSPSSSPWVTGWALFGLGEAKRRGLDVPAHALDAAREYARRAIEARDRDALGPAEAAFLLDVLARAGVADAGWTTRLWEKRAALPVFGRALLLDAMVAAKLDPAGIEELARELESTVRLDGPLARFVTNEGDRYAALLDSDARTAAMALRALVAWRPDHPLAARLAAGLLADRPDGTWRSTQETAWALLALGDYRRAQEATPPDFDARVLLGRDEIAKAAFHGRSAVGATTRVPAARVASGAGSTLAFVVEGQGQLFYQARLRYARRELPRDPLERGFAVSRSLHAVRAEDLGKAVAAATLSGETAFDAGGLVVGELLVVTGSPRRFVAIEDPLPAGVEAIDATLETSARSLDVDAAEPDEPPDDDARAKGSAFQQVWSRREVRDDRVLFFADHMPAGIYRWRWIGRATSIGTFVRPPARAEEMYTPETFGRTAAETITVRAK